MDFYESIRFFLEKVEVQCLRCGSCCQTWSVIEVPGYENGLKPEQQLCKHCEPARLDEKRQWQVATCKIHEAPNYPRWCRDFKMPSLGPLGGACALGLALWKRRQEQHPDSKLPGEVAKALRQFAMAQKLFERR